MRISASDSDSSSSSSSSSSLTSSSSSSDDKKRNKKKMKRKKSKLCFSVTLYFIAYAVIIIVLLLPRHLMRYNVMLITALIQFVPLIGKSKHHREKFHRAKACKYSYQHFYIKHCEQEPYFTCLQFFCTTPLSFLVTDPIHYNNAVEEVRGLMLRGKTFSQATEVLKKDRRSFARFRYVYYLKVLKPQLYAEVSINILTS